MFLKSSSSRRTHGQMLPAFGSISSEIPSSVSACQDVEVQVRGDTKGLYEPESQNCRIGLMHLLGGSGGV
eukprot:12929166-Prorocentrum_lima.AAC.1